MGGWPCLVDVVWDPCGILSVYFHLELVAEMCF